MRSASGFHGTSRLLEVRADLLSRSLTRTRTDERFLACMRAQVGDQGELACLPGALPRALCPLAHGLLCLLRMDVYVVEVVYEIFKLPESFGAGVPLAEHGLRFRLLRRSLTDARILSVQLEVCRGVRERIVLCYRFVRHRTVASKQIFDVGSDSHVSRCDARRKRSRDGRYPHERKRQSARRKGHHDCDVAEAM